MKTEEMPHDAREAMGARTDLPVRESRGDPSMSARFAYFYFMTNDPQRVRSLAPQHTAYWQGLSLQDYSGGPFADRTGGLITFVVDEPTTAEAAVAADPFVREHLLERSWLKRWDQIEPEATGRRGPVRHAQVGSGE